MIRHRRAVAAAVSLLCLGLTLVTIDSFSIVNLSSRCKINVRESNQYTSSRSYKDRTTSSRLFSSSDFSSHPYSVYYGTSGSTARQNFGQNNDINDVYGYGPEDRVREEPYDERQPRRHRGLRSMQDNPLMDGRRGATIFSGKYDEAFYHDSYIPDARDHLFHEERYVEDRHMMNEMDSLLYERDDLRRKLDAVVNENIYLQNQQNPHNTQVDPKFIPQGENQNHRPTNPMQNSMHLGQNLGTMSAVDSVMAELKNMQRTVHAVEVEQKGRNINGVGNSLDSHMNSENPTVERIKSDLRNMEQELQNLNSGQEPSDIFATNGIGHDASMGEVSQSENFSAGASASMFQQQSNADIAFEESGRESVVSGNASVYTDNTSQLFDGEYEVVIKAALKKKNGLEGARDPVEKQVDINNGQTSYGESFGSRYI